MRFFVTPHELERVDGWFERRGAVMVFIARLLPVVRTFIALPAGIARMNQVRFHVYTFLGSLPWCLALAYAGAKLGENWDGLRPYFHKFDFVLGIIIVTGARLVRPLAPAGAQGPAGQPVVLSVFRAKICHSAGAGGRSVAWPARNDLLPPVKIRSSSSMRDCPCIAAKGRLPARCRATAWRCSISCLRSRSI